MLIMNLEPRVDCFPSKITGLTLEILLITWYAKHTRTPRLLQGRRLEFYEWGIGFENKIIKVIQDIILG
jgi:hypothetical protein